MKFTPTSHTALWFSLAAIAALAATGCGSKTKTDEAATTPSDSAASNPEVAAQTGAVSLEDAADAISDGGAANSSTSLTESTSSNFSSNFSAQFSAAPVNADKDFTKTRTCSTAADTGVVTAATTFSGDYSGTRTTGKLTWTLTGTASGSDTHTWTPPAGQAAKISCSSADGHAKLKWLDADLVNGLKFDVAVDKSRSTSLTVTGGKRGGKTIAKSDSMKGKRSVTWATGATTDSEVTRSKTITSSITRIHSFTAKDGTVKTIEGSFVIDAATPLTVEVVRAISGGALKQKTVKSGTVTHTDKNGTVTSTKFTSVVFSFAATNSSRCVPVSGTLEITSAAKGSTESKKTTITFADSVGTVTAPDGTSETLEDYSPNCDLKND